MKKWKVVKGDGSLFKNAPEWCTQITSDEDGVRKYYEEAFGVIGAKFKNIREGAVWCLNNKDTFNDGLVVIAERELIEEKEPSPKRVKGPKQPKKTSNKVVVNYITGESYTIKGVVSVVLEDNSFQVFKEYKHLNEVFKFNGCEFPSKDVASIEIHGVNKTYIIHKSGDFTNNFAFVTQSGDFILSNSFSLVDF